MNWKNYEVNKTEKRCSLVNRKYLGSKSRLAGVIVDAIKETSGLPEVFFDAFLGTGAVSAAFIRDGIKKIVVCDNLLSNTAIFEGSFALDVKDEAVYAACLGELNELPGRAGYITEHFADRYFTQANCLRMDAIRDSIERKKTEGLITSRVFITLLASFLLAADRVANTLGQYDAFMKNLGKAGRENGRHLVDVRAYETFRLRPLAPLPPLEREILTNDVLAALGSVTADTAYFDPPYNGRQYCDNYHVLENLARWQKPAVKGKTKKFDRAALKSPFSQKKNCLPALRRLLENVSARHVYLSYNSEGIITRDELLALLAPFPLTKTWEIPYPVFGGGAGVAKKRLVSEYLFYFQKTQR